MGQQVCINAESESLDCSYYALLHATGQVSDVCLHTVALRQAPLQTLGKLMLKVRTMHLYLNMYVMTLHPGCSSACNFWSSLDMPFGSRYKKTTVAVERSLSKAFPQMMLTRSCKCSAANQTCPHCMHKFVLTDTTTSLTVDDSMLSLRSCFGNYFDSNTLQAYQPRGCGDNPAYTLECKQSSTCCIKSQVSCAPIQSSHHRCNLSQTGYRLCSGWQNRPGLLQHTAAV